MKTLYELIADDVRSDRDSVTHTLERAAKSEVFALWLRSRGFDPGDSIARVTCYTGSFTFHFSPDVAPGEIGRVLRHFVATTGIRLVKKFNEGSKTFEARGHSDKQGMSVEFSDFIPPSCKLVEEEIEVPETVVPAHTEKRVRVICEPPEEAEGIIEATEAPVPQIVSEV